MLAMGEFGDKTGGDRSREHCILKYWVSSILNFNIIILLLSAILKHWVSSILSYCADDDDILPIVLFAATHSDFYTSQV